MHFVVARCKRNWEIGFMLLLTVFSFYLSTFFFFFSFFFSSACQSLQLKLWVAELIHHNCAAVKPALFYYIAQTYSSLWCCVLSSICFCHIYVVDSLQSMINSLALWNLHWRLSFCSFEFMTIMPVWYIYLSICCLCFRLPGKKLEYKN